MDVPGTAEVLLRVTLGLAGSMSLCWLIPRCHGRERGQAGRHPAEEGIDLAKLSVTTDRPFR